MAEQILDAEKPTRKIYNEIAIALATIFGGPLVAGYLIAENFKAFNQTDKAKKTWFYAITATASIFAGLILTPYNIALKIPNWIIPLINVIIVSFLVQHFQRQNISAHIASGGQLFGWWRSTAVTLIGGTITIIFLSICLLLFSGSIINTLTSTKTYGSMKHEIIFVKENITEREVDKIANGLTTAAFFDNAVPKAVFVKRENNTYDLSVPVLAGTENNHQVLQQYVGLRDDLQKLFPNNRIVLNLTVDDTNNVIRRLE